MQRSRKERVHEFIRIITDTGTYHGRNHDPDPLPSIFGISKRYTEADFVFWRSAAIRNHGNAGRILPEKYIICRWFAWSSGNSFGASGGRAAQMET